MFTTTSLFFAVRIPMKFHDYSLFALIKSTAPLHQLLYQSQYAQSFVLCLFPKLKNLRLSTFFVYNLRQSRFKHNILRIIKYTFKNRVLYSCPIVYTLFCHFSQTTFTCFRFSTDIISNQYKHMASLFVLLHFIPLCNSCYSTYLQSWTTTTLTLQYILFL